MEKKGKEMEKNEKNEVVKVDNKKSVIAYEGKFTSAFAPDIINHIDKASIKLLSQFENISKDENLAEWKKAYLLGKIWEKYAILNGGKKAKKGDLLSFFKEGKSNFYNLLTASEWVKVIDGKLAVPTDNNGIAFTRSSYALIHKYKDAIKDGFFTAEMSQIEIREKLKLLNGGVIDEKEPTEEKTEAPTEEAPEEDEIELFTEDNGKEIDFAVIFKGKRVQLSDEQKARILEIILE